MRSGYQVGRAVFRLDQNGDAIAAWLEGKEREVRAAWFRPATGWGAVVPLGPSRLAADTLRVSIDGRGHAIVAWADPGDGLWAALGNAAGGFRPPAMFASMRRGGGLFDLAQEPAGRAIVAWRDTDDRNFDVRAILYHPSAGFGTPAVLPHALGTDLPWTGPPAVAIDRLGNAFVLWSDHALSNIVHECRYVAGQGWQAVNRLEMPQRSADSDTISVAVDGFGHATATWRKKASDSNLVSPWAARFVPGVGWGQPTRLEQANQRLSFWVALAVSYGGRAVSAWSHGVEQGPGTIRGAFWE